MPGSPVNWSTISSAILWASRRDWSGGTSNFLDAIRRNSGEVRSYRRISPSMREPRRASEREQEHERSSEQTFHAELPRARIVDELEADGQRWLLESLGQRRKWIRVTDRPHGELVVGRVARRLADRDPP